MKRTPTSAGLLALPGLVCGLAISGCFEGSQTPNKPNRPNTANGPSPAKKDDRYIQIRDLLRKNPDAKSRALTLFSLVKPICTNETERNKFLETAAWSASLSEGGEVKLTQSMAADTIEHVATTCFRSDPKVAYVLLDEAEKRIKNEYRFALVRARFFAIQDNYEKALEAARAAKEMGSFHAVALLANLQAQVARGQEPGYRVGMFDKAIETVTMEPNGKWHLVDVAAVLSTRAHLLTERAIWEPNEKRQRTLLLADETYRRLSSINFPVPIRGRAQDMLCYHAVSLSASREPCKHAAKDSKHLGAAHVVDYPLDGTFDKKRLERLEWLRGQLAEMKPKETIMLIVRGDETELIEWVHPTAVLLSSLLPKKPNLVVVDRTSSRRAGAMVDRLVTLSGIEPAQKVSAKRGALAMPCIAAVIADRRTPKSCPLDAATLKKLDALGLPKATFLVGRDLDAEIDDLKLYDLTAVLMSFRKSAMKKGISVWLKSATDVFVLTSPEKK